MKYLLDTCVISELASPSPTQAVVEWIDNTDDEQLYLSVITIGEIRRGISKLPQSRRRDVLTDWLNDELVPRFQYRTVTIDLDVALVWGDLVAQREAMGRPMPAVDSLIAAIALCHELTLVTRNVRNFDVATLIVANPWDRPR